MRLRHARLADRPARLPRRPRLRHRRILAWRPGPAARVVAMSRRVLVFGSRDWDDPAAVHAVLDGLYTEATVGHLSVELATFTVIEGGATGADAAAAWWAEHSPMHSHNEHPDDPAFNHLQFPANWPPKGSPRWAYATAAHDRNQRMVTEAGPTSAGALSPGRCRSRAAAPTWPA